MTNWQTKKLGDVLEKIEGGGTPSKEKKEFWNGSIPWASVKDLTSFNPKETQDYITDEGLKNSSSRLVKAGTLITPTRMALGFTVRFDVDVAINQDLKALYPIDDVSTEFIQYWFEAYRKSIERLGTGSTVAGIQIGELRALKIQVPEKPEQKRIVGVLEVWDEYIEKLEQKIALKEQLKKGLMQQLLTGKRRLPGFSEEWRTYKLGDFLQEPIYKRETNPKDIELLTVRLHTKGVQASGKFPFATEKGRPYYRRYQGEILVGRQNFHNGGVGEVTEKTNGLIASNAISSYVPKVNADLDFILFALQRGDFYKRIGHIIGGTGQKEISPSEFKKLKITMPELEEQKAIASVIKKSNEDLHTLYEYAKYINQQKKYLLRNLITGTIRTPDDL